MKAPELLTALPGLHGSTALFAPLLACRPPGVEVRTIELPLVELSYAELATRVAKQLPRGEPFNLLAESFSGPLALLAAQHVAPRRLILCATFVRSPFPRARARLPSGRCSRGCRSPRPRPSRAATAGWRGRCVERWTTCHPRSSLHVSARRCAPTCGASCGRVRAASSACTGIATA